MGYVVTYYISGQGWNSREFTAESKSEAVQRGRDFVWALCHLSGKTMRNAKWHVEKVEY